MTIWGEFLASSKSSSNYTIVGKFGFLSIHDVNITTQVAIGIRTIGSFIISVLRGASIVTDRATILLNPKAVPVYWEGKYS